MEGGFVAESDVDETIGGMLLGVFKSLEVFVVKEGATILYESSALAGAQNDRKMRSLMQHNTRIRT